ncbi:MAG: molecular chaperone DnaK [Candidatus Aminicenantales bacterium]|jgi:molecular chaperone DnaK
MGPIIGIDLGTTYSCMAHLAGGQPRVIPNLEGSTTTPSMAAFTASGDTLIGSIAARQAVTNPAMTLYAVKRLIGKKAGSPDVQKIRKRLPYKLAEAPNGDVLIDIGNRMITPQEVSALILAYLKRCAESYFGEDIMDAVITVPAHFGDHQRQATKDAAAIAGLNVLRVINEPTAASLAFGLDQKKNGRVAVFDMGGGTFDITLLEIHNGVFHILATNGDSFLGGEDFDQKIIDWFVEEAKKELGIDLSGDLFALQRIKEAAERAKRELSFTHETEINLPFIHAAPRGSGHFRKVISRSLLESLTADLVERPFSLVERTLEESGLKPGGIDHVILVGGQTRMPLVRERVSKFFRKKIHEHVHPDESVALGAAIQSGILEGELRDLVLLLDVTSFALGIETERDGYEKIIEKNATIPLKKAKAFTTVENNQRQVKIHVLQGDGPRASDSVSLAKFDLIGLLPALAGIPQIDVTFEIDADGLVKVSAKDALSGKEQKIVVRPSSGLSRQQINSLRLKARDKEAKT